MRTPGQDRDGGDLPADQGRIAYYRGGLGTGRIVLRACVAVVVALLAFGALQAKHRLDVSTSHYWAFRATQSNWYHCWGIASMLGVVWLLLWEITSSSRDARRTRWLRPAHHAALFLANVLLALTSLAFALLMLLSLTCF